MLGQSDRRCWRQDEWPACDVILWEQNCQPADPFSEPRYGADLRPDSRRKAAKGYGRWLSFLASHGWLDLLQHPFERVTRERLRHYFHELKANGNADYTIIGRFQELQMAIRVMSPGRDVLWIRKPYGVTIYAALPKKKRDLLIPDSGVLYAWALNMMDTADRAPFPIERATRFRNGLLFAILAARGRRIRSMSLLRIGQEIIYNGERYRIELPPEFVKTKVKDSFELPASLGPYIRKYLEFYRPVLLQRRFSNAFWIDRRGRPWTVKAMQERVLAHTKKRFGVAFGPHRFRHAAATTATLRDPATPALAACLLNASPGVVEQHYNRAGGVQAFQTLSELIDLRRKRVVDRATLARRA